MDYWYKYRDDLWKLVRMNDYDGAGCYHPRRIDSEEKIRANIRRAARMIEGYALCNDWDWFGTFTLNPAYRDRTDLDGFRKGFMQLLRNSRRKYGKIQALLVPEPHRALDGWHMHGLLQGIPSTALRAFTLREKLPKYIRDKIAEGQALYDWPEYRAAFGWVDMEPVRDRDAAARYITKYITKAGGSTAQLLELGKHLYYVTRGLRQPERVEVNLTDTGAEIENATGVVPEAFPAWLVAGNHYEFDYGEVQWFERPRFTPVGAGVYANCKSTDGSKSSDSEDD